MSKTRRTTTQEEISQGIAMYEAGHGLLEISATSGVSTSILSYHFRRQGVAMRPFAKQHRDVDNKLCQRCKVTKPIQEFHSSRNSLVTGRPIYGYCKPCARKASMAARNPEKVRNSRMVRTYGLHPEDYLRMVEAQNGECYICHVQTVKALYVDHNHSTGTVRKLLCHKCNSTLGFIGDSIEIAERLVSYLNEHRESN